MNLVTIRQPGYLPYLGFFKKIESCDVFVFLDDVQFEKNDWDNRNKIKTVDGSVWLTVPVLHKFGTKLNEIRIDNNQEWSKKHRKTIEMNYQKAKYFSDYWDDIESILNKKWEKLIDLNFEFITYFMKKLSITTHTVKSSELKITKTGSERLLEICKKLNSDTYLSGELGRNYLNEEIFSENKIDVIYEKFSHPVYRQIHGEFLPNMAVMDILFNEGENAANILKESKNR